MINTITCYPFASSAPPCCCRCHSDDPKHKLTACHKPCPRLLNCGHPCEAVCGIDPCPPCRRLVTITLECGHNVQVRCAQMERAGRSLCHEMVDVTMPGCGHKLRVMCGSVLEVSSPPLHNGKIGGTIASALLYLKGKLRSCS